MQFYSQHTLQTLIYVKITAHHRHKKRNEFCKVRTEMMGKSFIETRSLLFRVLFVLYDGDFVEIVGVVSVHFSMVLYHHKGKRAKEIK